MQVLLINPNRKNDVLAAPPIGLCYVATATKAAGYEVQVLDLCFSNNITSDLKKALRTFVPDVIGISIRNIDNTNLLYPVSYLADVEKVVSCIRKYSEARIVLGGAGASLCTAALLNFLQADFIVVSDGEESFVRLIGALKNGENPGDIPGVGMQLGGEFRLVRPKLRAVSFGNPSMGSWIDMKRYERTGSSYTIQTKRGCDYGCIYCTYGTLLEGNKLRLRSPTDVVDEIEIVVNRYRPKSLEFVDSVFNHPRDHCAEVLEEIVRRKLICEFTATGVSPRKLDGRFLDLMWRAGFRSFVLSPESASDSMIRIYGKSFTLDDLFAAAEALRKRQFTTMWCFLIGGPGESNDTLRETVDFTLKHLKLDKLPPFNIVNYYLGIRLYPGTKLWQIAIKEGFVSEHSNPLEQLWYVSQSLDLDLAMRQMKEAAVICPEIYLGFDEKFLSASRIGAFFGELFGIPRPYWRYIRRINMLMLKLGLRFRFQPTDAAAVIRDKLASQRDNRSQ